VLPRVLLAINPGDSPVVGERVIDGSIDLGIMIRPDGREKAGRLAYHDLFEDELGFLVSPLHPWAARGGRGRIDRREIADQRLVLYSRGSSTFRTVERWFVKMKTPLRDPIELGSMEAIKELVKLGLA
jgi:DNA-binding transcriptional LysR family regulator